MKSTLPHGPSPARDATADTVLLADLPAAPAEPLPTIGQIGRYALKVRIGAGGLGTVYAADDPLLSRRVAIKTLNLAGDGAPLETQARRPFDEMFLHEARAAAQLSHPYIVTVFDAGLSQTPGQGAYIAMELLKGKDLRELLAGGWRPSPAQAALIARRVADALAYAHSKGVVHRDIKPANIFMTGRTQPKVLDFGIASIAHAQANEGAAGVLGSPHYMAPEQVRGEATDRRTDVFSLGAVLYELLCGRRAFEGASLEAITSAVCGQEPPPAHEVAPEVPQALSEIAQRAMAKRPDDRTRSARALARELQQWLQGHPEAVPHGDEDPAARAPLWRRAAWAVLGASFVALLGLGIWQRSAEPTRGIDPPLARTAPPDAAERSARRAAPAPSATVAATAPPVSPKPPREASTSPAATMAPTPTAGPTPVAAREAASAADRAVAAGDAAPSAPAALPAPPAAPTRPAGAAPDMPPGGSAERGAPLADAEPAADGPSGAAQPAPLSRPRGTPAAAPVATAGPAAAPRGTLQLAVSPWAEVAVDGRPAGLTPPLGQLPLSAGRHTITLRNSGHPPHTATVTVAPEETTVLRYRFGP